MTATDSAEVRAFHRPFYDEWRRQHGTEDLHNGIASLLEEHGYTMTDVSVMLGLTRERVRQFVAQWGLVVGTKYTTARRIWDDEANRFRPVSVAEYQRAEKQRRRRSRWAWRRDRQLRMVNQLWMLAAKLGRTPTLWEFGMVAWFDREMPRNAIGPGVSGAWGGRKMSAATATKQLYERAGLSVRSNGSPGHVDGSKIHITDHERIAIRALRRSGCYSIKEIAQITGRSIQTVRNYSQGCNHA